MEKGVTGGLWRRALEMLWVMMSDGYFLARRDTARESSTFCSKLCHLHEEVVSKRL